MAAYSYRPDNLPEIWERIEDKLERVTWGAKGLEAKCPFCKKPYDIHGALKFTAFFNNGRFTGYSCFRCTEKGGSSFDSMQRLASAIGISLSWAEHQSAMIEDLKSFEGFDDEEWSKGIDWPPEWIDETDDVYQKGLAEFEKRNVLNAISKIDKGQIYFSNNIQLKTKLPDGSTREKIKEYPSVVFPMLGDEMKVLGWTTRYLDKILSEDFPKTITASGKEWKKHAVVGLNTIDPRKPISITEGPFDHLATPNSIATAGKAVSREQMELIAKFHAKFYIFALDPDVDTSKEWFQEALYQLSTASPGSEVLTINWRDLGAAQKEFERINSNLSVDESWKRIIKKHDIRPSSLKSKSWTDIIMEYEMDPDELGEKKMVEIIKALVKKNM